MDRIKVLQLTQQRLLRAWLRAGDGEQRFAILSELRSVERQLGEELKRSRIGEGDIRTYAVQQAR